MKIDIIISILNGADYIEESVNSIISQTYTKWHLYLIDNGSSDDTYKLIKKLQLKDQNRISLITFKHNKKPSTRWMQIINESTADAIAISCHDDFWEKTKLNKQVEILKVANADIVHTNIKLINSDGKLINNGADKENKYRNSIEYNKLSNIELANEFTSSNSIRLSSVLIKNNLFKKFGGWEKGIWGGEDWGLWVKFAAENSKYHHIEEQLTIRRVHFDNASSSSGYDRSFGFLKAIKIIEKKYPFLNKNLVIKRNKIYERIIIVAIKCKKYETAKKYSKFFINKKKKTIRDIFFIILAHSGRLGVIIMKIKKI
jgi:teichuronic acid biosynthesis glycosyltransferase TuaG